MLRNIRDPAYRRRSFLSNLKLIHYRNGSKEMISFVKENGKLLVDDYKYIYEDKLRCTFPETH